MKPPFAAIRAQSEQPILLRAKRIALALLLGLGACQNSGGDDPSTPADAGPEPVAGASSTPSGSPGRRPEPIAGASSTPTGSPEPVAGASSTPSSSPPRPPDAEGGQSGDPGSGGPLVCNGERWTGPDQPWVRARCNPTSEGFSCECSEQDPAALDANSEVLGTRAVGPASFVAGCREALSDQCGIDPDAPLFCSSAGVGTCWPADDGGWSCECGAGLPFRVYGGVHCGKALWAQCGDRCETPFGECGEQSEGQYRCLCTGEDEPSPPAPEPPPPSSDGTVPMGGVVPTPLPSCAAAMASYCGERCENSAGRCTPTDGAFECTCSAGGSATQPFAELGGISPAACGTALQRSCGEELIAPMPTCTVATAKCEALPRIWPVGTPRPDSFEYRCRCNGAQPVSVDARTCGRALSQACPGSIAPDALRAPAAARQLGAQCAHDGDCDGGICHIGKLGRDGVCSGPCAADSDCPAGGLCAFAELGDPLGRCFLECEEPFECETLNEAFDDPLVCSDPDWLPYGRLLREGECSQLCAPISDEYWPLPVQR